VLNRRTLWAAFLLICSGVAASDAAAQNNPSAAYVVMGPQGAVARAVFEGTATASCPKIDFGVDQPPLGTKSASILGGP
jgi:hypothetical protein